MIPPLPHATQQAVRLLSAALASQQRPTKHRTQAIRASRGSDPACPNLVPSNCQGPTRRTDPAPIHMALRCMTHRGLPFPAWTALPSNQSKPSAPIALSRLSYTRIALPTPGTACPDDRARPAKAPGTGGQAHERQQPKPNHQRPEAPKPSLVPAEARTAGPHGPTSPRPDPTLHSPT